MDGLPRLAALRCGLDGRLPCGDEWETPRFWSPPVVRQDVWEVAYLEKGWLVRSHGDRRVRRFHPVHRRVPIDVSLLEGPRITVSFDDRGERSVTRDLWTDPPCNQYTPKRNWVGWTFLKVREGHGRGQEPTYGTMESGAEPSSEMLGQLCVGGVSITFDGSNADSQGSRVRASAAYGAASSSEGSGYRVGSVIEKGKFVADQMPVPLTEMQVSPMISSGEEDWEKIKDEEDSW